MALISIIIPVYNVQKYLNKCIESAINQTMKDIEILLINDGSTDKSGEICDYYAKSDSRIRVIHKENEGVSSARNIGLDLATGQWIAFLDSDDWIEENMYEILYENAIKQKVDICACNFEYFTKDNISLYNKDLMNGLEGIYTSKEFMDFIYEGQHKNALCVCIWNKIYKKSIFNNLRFINSIHEDEQICTQIYSKKLNIYLLGQPLYKYIQVAQSITNKKFSKENLVNLDILYERCSLFKSVGYVDLFIKSLKEYCDVNIGYYFKIKELDNEIDYKRYFEQYNKILLEIINKKILLKDKIRFIIFYINPILYKKLISMKENYKYIFRVGN
ncbi:glycosyltransferase [Clostridium celatum]|uniref:Glycosyltransferase, group 2 family protein n=1 Tax=Clostridium celatum DSM 1785 TaxID=545697 RepID=L1QM03_9CLOT|nr:glycosyltransferase [Clostridium celatum]EKY29019.1 glycosyltransferase, group 2 family protein [Clostridium celatum DSM 1785]MCE9654419.1 glycosyltransferase [Clostridium celatum]